MSSPKDIGLFLRRRNLVFISVLLLIAAVAIAASLITEFDLLQSFAAFPKAIAWLANNFVPDEKALARLPTIMTKLGETILVSVMATTTAAVVAFLMALLASTTTRPHPVFTIVIRAIASVFRNIPSAVWALVFLMTIGQTVLTGFLALFLETLGFLIRAFIDSIEETAASSVEALHASGATWGQTVAHAVVPSTSPQILSWMLYLLETNIRSATLVGILTGTGIGFLFDLYYKSLNYPSAALVIIAIVIVVLLLELLSNAIRKVIL